MPDEPSELIRDILASFPDRRLPRRGIAVWEGGGGEDDTVRDQLAGRSWKSFGDVEILQVPACFLTHRAKAILLPAIMIADLHSPSSPFRVGELLLDPAENDGPSYIDPVAHHLEPNQRSVVAQYLDLGCQGGDAAACRALAYWKRFLVDD
jgi:hypothetical protein